MKNIKLNKVLSMLILVFGAIIMLFPFLWMFMSAFKSPAEVVTTPPTWIPNEINLNNFKYVFETAPFGKYFLNSIIITVSSVTITTFTTILAAFAFSRFDFKGRDIIFSLTLSLMMVPFELLIITNYQTIASIEMTDKLIALIIPFTSSIFYTYILRNFFLSIPDSIYWSARIDGANNWKYLWRVMVPMARPAIVTIVLLNTITSWNAFFWPLLVVNTKENRTLQLGLYAFITEGGVKYEKLMAASTVVVIPVIILFLFLKKHIVNGVANSGTKG